MQLRAVELRRKRMARKVKEPTEKKGRKTTPPFEEWPAWTEAKFFSFLRSGLRAKWSRWPAKYAVLAEAKRDHDGKNPRQKYEYKCAECKKHYPQKEVSVDHIEPVGTLRTYEDLPDFCRRLFVGTDKLQVLCKGCHGVKTYEENQERTKRNASKS
jgi:hypothetical protein